MRILYIILPRWATIVALIGLALLLFSQMIPMEKTRLYGILLGVGLGITFIPFIICYLGALFALY